MSKPRMKYPLTSFSYIRRGSFR